MHAEQLECGYAFEEGRDGVRASSRFYSDRSGGHGRDTFMVGGLGFNSNTSIVGHSNRLVTQEVAHRFGWRAFASPSTDGQRRPRHPLGLISGIVYPANGRAKVTPRSSKFALGRSHPANGRAS